MLRRIFRAIKAKHRGTPVQIGTDRYLIPAITVTSPKGAVYHEISAKDIALVIISDQLETDDPQAILREYNRRKLINEVRHAADANMREEAELDAAAGPSLPPIERKAEIIAFPGNGERRKKPTMRRPTARLAENQLARVTDDGGPERAKDQEIATQSATVDVATIVERVLSSVEDAKERQLFREFLDRHPDMAQGAMDENACLSLYIDSTGKVRSRYVRYSHGIPSEVAY